jgi:glycosyltransferase involved in cell wall biosynthesis
VLAGSRVVVIVPAFREEAHVADVVATMPSFVDAIVLVDDGSPDLTTARARAVGDKRLHVERHPERRGVGAALTTGYRRALALTDRTTDALCVMAGDGQMDPLELEPVALPVVRGAADYVKGDRFGDPTVRRAMGLPRWIGGQVFTRLTALAIGQPISDSQCGFTALARGAAVHLDLDGLWPGFGYPNDLLGQLAARDCRLIEVPVRPIYGLESSKLRLRHLPPIFWLIARAAVRRRAGRVIRTGDGARRGLRGR